jgi:hypothetical protein
VWLKQLQERQRRATRDEGEGTTRAGERNCAPCTPSHARRLKGTARPGHSDSSRISGRPISPGEPQDDEDTATICAPRRRARRYVRPVSACIRPACRCSSSAPSPIAEPVRPRDETTSSLPSRTARRPIVVSRFLDHHRDRKDKGSTETERLFPWTRWLKWTGRAWLFSLQYFGPPTDAATQVPWKSSVIAARGSLNKPVFGLQRALRYLGGLSTVSAQGDSGVAPHTPVSLHRSHKRSPDRFLAAWYDAFLASFSLGA